MVLSVFRISDVGVDDSSSREILDARAAMDSKFSVSSARADGVGTRMDSKPLKPAKLKDEIIPRRESSACWIFSLLSFSDVLNREGANELRSFDFLCGPVKKLENADAVGSNIKETRKQRSNRDIGIVPVEAL